MQLLLLWVFRTICHVLLLMMMIRYPLSSFPRNIGAHALDYQQQAASLVQWSSRSLWVWHMSPMPFQRRIRVRNVFLYPLLCKPRFSWFYEGIQSVQCWHLQIWLPHAPWRGCDPDLGAWFTGCGWWKYVTGGPCERPRIYEDFEKARSVVEPVAHSRTGAGRFFLKMFTMYDGTFT